LAQGGEEIRAPGEPGELHRGNGAPARRLLEAPGRMDDLARPRHMIPAHELDPLDVPDNRDPHPHGGFCRAGEGERLVILPGPHPFEDRVGAPQGFVPVGVRVEGSAARRHPGNQ
jgi:hypothetical protein